MNRAKLLEQRSKIVTAALVVVALVMLAVWRHPIAAWFTGTSSGGSVGQSVRVDAGALSLAAALEPDVFRQQAQSILVDVGGSGGAKVTGAKVTISWDMPPMGAMAEMKGDATVVEEGDGRYRGTFDLPMGGSWTIKVGVESTAGSAAQDFTATVGHAGLVVAGGGTAPPSSGVAVMAAPLTLPAQAVDSLRAALDAYDRIHDTLAADRIEGIATDAHTLAEAARAAHHVAGTVVAAELLATIAGDGDRLATAASLDDARAEFVTLSRDLIGLTARVPELQAGWRVFQCPMADGKPRWMQRPEAPSNPFLGAKMGTCGNADTWASLATASAGPDIEVTIDEAHQQLIGVRTAPVRLAPMKKSIRAIGKLTYDESTLTEVNLKVRGWIRHLYVTKTGQRVQRGEALFTLYSPEIYAAEQDYLLASRSQAGGPNVTSSFAAAARQKLHLLGVDDGQLDAMLERGTPTENVTYAAPASGFVIEKNVVEGAAIEPGMRLFRIAALGNVWVEAEVYEGDLAHVTVGEAAKVTLDYLPGKSWDARVGYVYPYLDDKSRTGRVRIVLANPQLELRPGMYATVTLEADLGERLQVPIPAVVYTGLRRLVFVDKGNGHFGVRVVTLGTEAAGMVEVLNGLQAGESVVTTGAFLVAADARLDTSAPYWEPAPRDAKAAP